MTLFHSSILNLAKIFLDPLNNDDYSQSMGINVATLLQETNLGSTRWLKSASWLPEQALSSGLRAPLVWRYDELPAAPAAAPAVAAAAAAAAASAAAGPVASSPPPPAVAAPSGRASVQVEVAAAVAAPPDVSAAAAAADAVVSAAEEMEGGQAEGAAREEMEEVEVEEAPPPPPGKGGRGGKGGAVPIEISGIIPEALVSEVVQQLAGNPLDRKLAVETVDDLDAPSGWEAQRPRAGPPGYLEGERRGPAPDADAAAADEEEEEDVSPSERELAGRSS